MSSTRAALVVALVPLLLALAVTTAVAGWHLTLEPDAGSFKINDVVTGRTHIQYLARSRESGDLTALFYCSEARFFVTKPDGSTVGMIQRARNSDAESWPFRLSDGEEVLLPVCLAKWANQFVFSAAGNYRILVSLTLEDMKSRKSSIATAAPVEMRIVDVGAVPQGYMDALGESAICGAFRYHCRTNALFQRWRQVDFGEYTEPFFAFMTYQLWDMWVASYIYADTRKHLQWVDIGMAAYRARTGCVDCRGAWIVERLEAMRAARTGKPYGPVEFGASELVFPIPSAL